MSVSPTLLDPSSAAIFTRNSYPAQQIPTDNRIPFQAFLPTFGDLPQDKSPQSSGSLSGEDLQALGQEIQQPKPEIQAEDPFDVRLGFGYVPQFHEEAATPQIGQTQPEQKVPSFGGQRLDLMGQHQSPHLPGVEAVVQKAATQHPIESGNTSLQPLQTSSLLQNWDPSLDTNTVVQSSLGKNPKESDVTQVPVKEDINVSQESPSSSFSTPFPLGSNVSLLQSQGMGEGTSSYTGTSLISQVLNHVPYETLQQEGTHRFQIQLHPKELGEIQVDLTVSKEGKLQAAFSGAAQALEVLQQGTHLLCSALQQEGFEVQQEAFSFNSNPSFQQESQGKEAKPQPGIGATSAYASPTPSLSSLTQGMGLHQLYQSQGTGLSVNVSV